MRLLLLFPIVGLLIASAVIAAVPNTMNVQGRLLNAGSSMTGTYPAIFSIYDATTVGNLLWTESSSLDAQSGIFTATLGTIAPIPTIVFDSGSRWLEVTVDGNTLSPRIQLTTNAYAFHSQHADTANFALNSRSTGDNLWSTNGTDVWREGGKVGIGVPAPTRPLMLEQDYSGDWLASMRNSAPNSGHGLLVQAGTTNGERIAAFQDKVGTDRFSFYAGGRMNIMGSLGFGPSTPWASDGIYLDAASQQSTIAWDNRANAGFQMYQAANTNIFNFTSTGGGSSETWNFISAGVGNLMTVGPTVTVFRNLQVNGSLNVNGTKCRVVTTDFGRLSLNAVESSHALFMDDEPSARLENGKCRINLSPRFLATVTVNGQYPLMVNVTFYESHGGNWYVERDDSGFTVIDPSGSNAEFSWQAIARQQDYEQNYLEPADVQTARK